MYPCINISEQVYNELKDFKIDRKYKSLHYALHELTKLGVPSTHENTKGLENIKWKTIGVPIALRDDLMALKDKAQFKSLNNLIHNLLKGAKKHEKRS